MTIQEDLRRKLSSSSAGNSTSTSSSNSTANNGTNPTANLTQQPHQYVSSIPLPLFAGGGGGAPLTATLSLPINAPTTTTTTSSSTSTSNATSHHHNAIDPERTYVFPGAINSNPSTNTTTTTIVSHRIGRTIGDSARGHARSVSHGGSATLVAPPGAPNPTHSALTAPQHAPNQPQPPPSTATANITTLSSGKILRSAMKGHQRAFSQGQIVSLRDASTAGIVPSGGPAFKRPGHNRVGSKTDFILPPGHKDSAAAAQIIPRAGDLAAVGDLAGAGTGGDDGGTGNGAVGGTGSRIGSGHSRQASRSESIYTLRRAEMPPWWRRWAWRCCRAVGCAGGASAAAGRFQDERDRHRVVVPNHTVPAKTPKRDHPNGKRVGNKIRTTKYTLLSFVPNNLLEQFHRLANLYFIFIVLLNWYIDAFAKEVTMIPVVFVLGVTACKDLFEDRRRRASDKRINNSTCRVYNG